MLCLGAMCQRPWRRVGSIGPVSGLGKASARLIKRVSKEKSSSSSVAKADIGEHVSAVGRPLNGCQRRLLDHADGLGGLTKRLRNPALSGRLSSRISALCGDHGRPAARKVAILEPRIEV